MASITEFGSEFQINRILAAYGNRGGTLVNATGTGAELIISPMNDTENGSNGNATDLTKFFNTFGGDGKLHITSLAPVANPIRTHDASIGGIKRALSGRVYGYRKKPVFEVDVTVIGNSIDYYRLMMLGQYYLNYDKQEKLPLLSMLMVFASAPGLTIEFSDGMLTTDNPGVSITNNPRIEDKTFSFQFGAVSAPSESEQKYGNPMISSYLS